MVGCTFAGNSATGPGGGVSAVQASVVGCSFFGNTAFNGGGGFYGTGRLANCVLSGNSAALGGGVRLLGGQPAGPILNCTIVSNTAESGGGVYLDKSPLTVANSILWGNVDDSGTALDAQYSDSGDMTAVASFYYCDVQGWNGSLKGEGSFAADPFFFDPDGPDGIVGTPDDLLYFAPGSPLIDAGDVGRLPPDWHDLDKDEDTAESVPFDINGNVRRFDDPGTIDGGAGPAPVVDLGAYEYVPQGKAVFCYPDLNGDGVLNLFDFLAFANTFNAGLAPADCNADSQLTLFDFLCFVNAFNAGCN